MLANAGHPLARIRINIGGSGQNVIIDGPAGLTSGQHVDFVRFGAPAKVGANAFQARVSSNLAYQMDYRLSLVSVRMVPGYPAVQATALSRPTLRQTSGKWHLENDGGDSLPVTLRAGTYGRAWVSAAGVVTVDTVANPTGALIPTGVSATQADVILRAGAFSPAEEASIRAYWGVLYA